MISDRFWGVVSLGFVALFCFWHLSISIPYAFHDLGKSDTWRAVIEPYQGDEIRNRARAQSLIEYTYRTNPILEREEQHVWLRLGSWLTTLTPANRPLEDRVLITLRVMAATGFALAMLCAYLLYRTAFSPLLALALWICFACGSADYLHLGFIGKEDSLCLMMVEAALAMLVLYWKKRKPAYLWAAAAFIGLGAATKQYPLLMIPTLWPAACDLRGHRRSGTLLFAGLVTVVFVIFLGCNPNFFLSPLSNAADLTHYYVLGAGDGVNPDAYSRWVNAGRFFYSLFIIRYIYVWLPWALYFAAKRYSASLGKPVDGLWRTVAWIATCFGIYYAGCLYKVQIMGSVRYFLVGELAIFLVFGWGLQALGTLPLRGAQLASLALAFALAIVFPLRRSQGSYQAQLIDLKRNVFAARASTWEPLLKKAVSEKPGRAMWIKTEAPASILRGGFRPFNSWVQVASESQPGDLLTAPQDEAPLKACFTPIFRSEPTPYASGIAGSRSGGRALRAAFVTRHTTPVGPALTLYRNDCGGE